MSEAKRIPVILDTDIGGDIDDTWALTMLLKSPELDLRLVTTCTGDTTYRAMVAAKILEVAGRRDVPVGIGPADTDHNKPQKAWVNGYTAADYPGQIHTDGALALIDAIMCSDEMVTIIAIGPFTTIAEALRREPRIAKRSRIVAMAGNIRKPYGDATTAIPEYNVRIDVPAARAVFAASWEIVITPLDTCGFVVLSGDLYQEVLRAEDPLTRALVQNYQAWCASGKHDKCERESTVLFDTVAVYLAFSEKHLVMDDMKLTIEDDGFTAISPIGRPVRSANEWRDLGAFNRFLVDRIVGRAPVGELAA